MSINEDHIWAPMPDSEIRKRAETYIADLGLHDVVLQSGAHELSVFSPTSKLYILAHGHSQMPLFTNKNGRWSATQVAKMLEGDGLPKDQRDIELLVCHAGQSVNDKQTGAKLLRINEEVAKAKAESRGIDKLRTRFDKTAAKGTGPAFFESNPATLLLPLAAELAQALKYQGFSNFRIISYKCPVAQFSAGGHVHLDLSSKGGKWGVRAKDNPSYRVVWQ